MKIAMKVFLVQGGTTVSICLIIIIMSITNLEWSVYYSLRISTSLLYLHGITYAFNYVINSH